MNCLTCGRALGDGEACRWHLKVECSVCHRAMAPKPCEERQDGKTSHGYCEACFDAEVAKLPEASAQASPFCPRRNGPPSNLRVREEAALLVGAVFFLLWIRIFLATTGRGGSLSPVTTKGEPLTGGLMGRETILVGDIVRVSETLGLSPARYDAEVIHVGSGHLTVKHPHDAGRMENGVHLMTTWTVARCNAEKAVSEVRS